jgi:asparagine synthase (glutamine-hydrolysing)
VSELLHLIGAAVAKTLDGPGIGVVVSGGVDSSTVCALAQKERPGIPTFTGFYSEPGFSELPYACQVADQNHHHRILITPQDFIENFDAFATHMKPPYQGMGAFGQYMVGKYLSEHGIKVALSGEGSDELFGGYARLLKVAGEKLPDGYENYQLPADYPTTVEEALAYDYERLPDLLAVDDQCMNAWGIEARAPFTDTRVVEYGLSLPVDQRIGKRHLKAAVRGLVPDVILNRTDKKGFPIPLNLWAQGECREFIRDRIGYIPDPSKPWDRGFWYDLLKGCSTSVAA